MQELWDIIGFVYYFAFGESFQWELGKENSDLFADWFKNLELTNNLLFDVIVKSATVDKRSLLLGITDGDNHSILRDEYQIFELNFISRSQIFTIVSELE